MDAESEWVQQLAQNGAIRQESEKGGQELIGLSTLT